MCVSLGSSEHPNLEYVEVLIVNILPVVPIKKNVFFGPVKLLKNVGPKFELSETVKDEDVKLFDIVVIPETFNDDKHVVLFDVVKPEILSEDKHETLLLNVVKPVTYNNVLILMP